MYEHSLAVLVTLKSDRNDGNGSNVALNKPNEHNYKGAITCCYL